MTTKVERLQRERDSLLIAIREHRDTLDAQANGTLPRLDRDDVDNALYNVAWLVEPDLRDKPAFDEGRGR